MMGICSHVLYQALQEDLASAVPGYQPGEPWPGMTPRQFAASALDKAFYKKFVEKVHPEADDRAFAKFLQVNEACRDWVLSCNDSRDEVLVGELKSTLYNFFYPEGMPLIQNQHQILDAGRTGPGASRLARGNDFYTKLFDSPLSVTSSGLYSLYSDYLSSDPSWFAAEEFRANHYGDCQIVEGSQLHFVPKSDDISRLIAIEPNLNMYFQLGLGAILERRLESFFGISLERQPDKNRELARIGSLDGSFSTIDLSSASDSLSLPMLREVLPKPVLNWFLRFRSPFAEYKGEQVKLEMISTMGNGYTFPLETILFASVVSAASSLVRQELDKPWGRRLGNFAVFGDDIICKTGITRQVIRLLELLGFSVNQQKSFVEGPFRESCGRDWYKGRDVRGVYLKSLQTMQDRYVAINGLNLWSAKTGIPLSRTVGYLRSTVRYQPVPPWEDNDSGIRVPLDLVLHPKRSESGNFLYRKEQARPSRLKISDCDIRVPKRSKARLYNPEGLLQAFLRGYIRTGKDGVGWISLRHKTVSYNTKWATAPNWDWLPLGCDILVGTNSGYYDYLRYKVSDLNDRRSSMSQSSWGRWKSAVYFNLLK
jgi:hypothetical protein